LGVLPNLPPGATLGARIPVVDAAGAPAGSREVGCQPADLDGRARCSAVVADKGIFPQLGGTVEVQVSANPPLPAFLPTAPLAPPPPIVLPPPPPPLLVPLPAPSLAGPAAATDAPELPVIPEAPSLGLLLASLALLGGWAWGRRR
jgi:hypothetical protein